MQTKPFKTIKPKQSKVIRGYTIKFHANGETMWSKGKVKNRNPNGYWEWYRIDGTLKRSGYFNSGTPVGKWTTYDAKGKVYKVSDKG